MIEKKMLNTCSQASERELDWILRISIAIVSFVSAGVALSVRSVHDLA